MSDKNTRAPIISSQTGEKVFRHHANETLEETEYLLRQSIPAPSWLERDVARASKQVKQWENPSPAPGGMGDLAVWEPDAWMREDGSAATVNPMIAGGWKGQGMTVVPLYARTAAQSAEVREAHEKEITRLATIEECAKIAEQHATETEVANSDKDAVRIYNMARDEAAFAIRSLAQAGGKL